MLRLILDDRKMLHDSYSHQTILESTEMKQQLSAKNFPHSAVHIWLMSFIVAFILVLALAAAARLPHYLATGDVVRLVGTAIFNLVALAGVVNNAHTHVLFWQSQHTNQPEMVVQN